LVSDIKGGEQTEDILEEGTEETTRDEVTGGWRKLHNEEHHNLSKSMRFAGHVAQMGRRGMRKEYCVESIKKKH
jgi:hypothetical protein